MDLLNIFNAHTYSLFNVCLCCCVMWLVTDGLTLFRAQCQISVKGKNAEEIVGIKTATLNYPDGSKSTVCINL